MTKLYTALITPFQQQGSIDYQNLELLFIQQHKGGVDGVVLLGTTGESELLNENEKRELIEYSSKNWSHKLDLIYGCGKSSTEETIEQIKLYKTFGAKKFMVLTPMYVKPSQQGIYEHFRMINDLDIPFIVYHHPTRTGCQPTLKTLEQILNLNGCIGLKDASGSCELIAKFKDKYCILSGDDGLLLPHLSLGAQGIISVISNLIPNQVRSVLDHFSISPKHSLDLFSNYQKLLDIIFEIPNPIGIKSALSETKQISRIVRLPYVFPGVDYLENLQEALHDFFPNEIGLEPISDKA